ncbi:hypothetical protein GQ607_000915 [Colletotrichum asianum]|uniref:Uncharacterized protein n=1 Tax=Colletotrichum asianum TaxID=702518 RepID=A0A8H3ZZ13_9PEZI|nr:hypothetical protein GQ607_000915 [Colletotrichum asianum]
MSQPDKRKLYTPLEICYQLRRISRTSSSGLYAIKSSQDLTYCGTLMVSQEGQGSPRISTVGGLIQILDWTYALTTSHPPDPSEDGSDDEDEADFDNVCQDVEIVGEWQLCLIRPGSRRPNLILDGSDRFSLDSQAVQSYSSSSRMSNSSPREVLVISGRSGLKRGSLSRTPSAMLLGKQGLQEVWTIGLWHDLQAGDSGSWVISKDRHSLLGVVVARSTGCAYMVSFSQIQKDLGAHWNLPPDAVKLPRDFSWGETMYDMMVAVFNTAKPYVDRIRDPFRIFRRTTRGGEVEGL